MIYSIMVIVQVVVALSLIGLILVQHGKGADAGAAFGSGASGTVFGAQGTANFLSRATAALATFFFVVSLSLAYLVNGTTAPTGSVTDQLQQQTPPAAAAPDSKSNTGSNAASVPDSGPQNNGVDSTGAGSATRITPSNNGLPQAPEAQPPANGNSAAPGSGKPNMGGQNTSNAKPDKPRPDNNTDAQIPQ